MSQPVLFSGSPNKPKIRIEQYGNDYAVITPYNKDFVTDLKAAVSVQARNWDSEKKAWIIRSDWIEHAANAIQNFYGERPEIPELTKTDICSKFAFQLDYVGIPKLRDNLTIKTALGLSKGQWRVVFEESVLKNWFQQDAKSNGDDSDTLFKVLLVSEKSTDHEIKSGYKRLARQWHPDVCHEENAREKFLEISRAYEILIDPIKRARYEAGLFFERSQQASMLNTYPRHNDLFIPPLRCGNLVVTGSLQVGRLHVSQILEWEDVINEQGQIMVSSWNKATEAIQIEWV